MWIEHKSRRRVIDNRCVDDLQLDIQLDSVEELQALIPILSDPALWSDRLRGADCLRIRTHLRPEVLAKIAQVCPAAKVRPTKAFDAV